MPRSMASVRTDGITLPSVRKVKHRAGINSRTDAIGPRDDGIGPRKDTIARLSADHIPMPSVQSDGIGSQCF